MADTWIKFCGCTAWNDVELAIEAGADAFGMIFAPSPRRISWSAAAAIAELVPQSIAAVGVFVNPTEPEVDFVRTLFPRAWLQFCGKERPEFVARYGKRAIKTIPVDRSSRQMDARCDRFPQALLLFDSQHDGMAGGTGRTFAWKHAAPIARTRRIVIAGGLTPGNVSECLEATHPFGVDVRSGIETNGEKDSAKMGAFVRAVRAA